MIFNSKQDKLIDMLHRKCIKDKDGKTAAHWAAERNATACLEMLLNKGADMHAQDKDGKTAVSHLFSNNGLHSLAAKKEVATLLRFVLECIPYGDAVLDMKDEVSANYIA